MSKEQNVINYYVICNRLKNVIRTGWKNWNVQRERIESVAEHIFRVQMLALAMKSKYQYDVNIMKVIFMLAVQKLQIEQLFLEFDAHNIPKNQFLLINVIG